MNSVKALYLLLAAQTLFTFGYVCFDPNRLAGVIMGCGVGFIIGLIRAEKKLDDLVEKFRGVEIRQDGWLIRFDHDEKQGQRL